MSGRTVKGLEEWENILVGDENCSFVEVRDILSKSVSAIKLWEKLWDVARSLSIPPDKLLQLRNGISTTTITYSDALYQILESWRGKEGEHASLHNLLSALETNELNECAAALQKVISERLSFIGKKIVLFQGQEVQLDEVFHDGTIDEKLVTSIERGEVPDLVKTQVPDKLEYYIQRKVMSGNRLEIKLLQGKHNDVFLIEGMQKYELTKLVGEKEATDVSGNQILRLTVRFIHLEHHGDFEKICKLASTPVHWIKHVQNGFVWVKSSGSVEALQRYVENEQDSVEEDDFVSNTDKVVVISDSPGMGKTILLHNIAHKVMEHTPTVLVRFIVLKELVQAFDGKEVNTESLAELIAEQSTEYAYGRELVAHALKTLDCVLLFDGFDEVLPNQIHSAEQILTVAVALKSARVIVATRPHMRQGLENTLHVLSHTIKPFEHQDQVQFLMKYWSIEGAKGNESLQQFATTCLETLSTKMTDFEREVAEIPLQCRLLAEVYTVHAIRCSEIGYEAHQESINMAVITSMFDMYEMHMNMRLQKIMANEEESSNQFELVKQAHMYHALQLLFPEHVDHVQLSEESKHIPTKQFYSLGIVEDAHSGRFRFVHRTFAEYLVAWFAIEVGLESREFILLQVLSTKSNELYWFLNNFIANTRKSEHPFENLQGVKSFEFNFPLICYFINGFAKKQRKRNISVPSIMNTNLYNQVAPVFTASAYHDYAHIPAFVASCFGKHVTKKTENNNISDLLLVTAKNSGVELMKIFCSSVHVCSMKFLITQLSPVSFKFMITPLHVAVRRGNYQIVEYLLNKFKRHYHKLEYLIHFCVFGSMKDSKSTLNDKKNIIRLLMEKNKLWADEPLNDGRTPLLQDGTPLELVECLIQQGADVNVKDKYNNNLLHRVVSITNYITDYIISPESYHKILLALQQHKFQHFNTANDENLTPLQCAITNILLLEESVRIFHSVGADFNAVDKQGDSLLFYTIRGWRSPRLIHLMIQLGANWKHINLKRQGVLHICAHGNYEALKFFIENYEVDINSEDIRHCTPLHYAVLGRSESFKSIQMLLVEKGADVIARDEMNMTPFDKAFAEGVGLSSDVIQLMEKRGLILTKQLVSKALTQVLLYTKLPRSEEDYANMLEYLIGKGGEADFQFTKNLWEWGGVQKIMPEIIEKTIIRTSLIDKAKTCGLFEGLKKVEHFYDVVKKKAISFERVFMILVADTQYGALQIFIKCLKEANERLCSITFTSLSSGVKEFIKSAFFEIANFSVGHQIGNPIDCIYLSPTIFHYFIIDKLAFVGISLEELNDLCKYGQKIGSFGEDIHNLDYIVLEEKNQFLGICRSTNSDVHLIEYHEGQLKLLQTRGSQKHIHRFFEEKMLCKDFPSCNCSSEAVFVNLSLRLEKEDEGEMLSCSVNVTQIQPLMLQILNIQDSIQLYELRKLYQQLIRQDSTSTKEASYKPPFSNHITQIVEDIVQHLECSHDERKQLQRLAVNTLFPELNADIDNNTMGRFVELLEKKDDLLVFHNHTIAWYFIAELVVNDNIDNHLDYEHVDEIRKAIFSDCFQPHRVQVSHKWWEKSVYYSDKIKSFRFKNDMLFKFIESNLSDAADTSWFEDRLIPQSKNSLLQLSFGNTKNLTAFRFPGSLRPTIAIESFQTQNKPCLTNDFMTKCVHACVLGSHRKLLKIIFELPDDSQTLVSKHIALLAVMYSEVETIAYSKPTNEKLQEITLELRNDKTGHVSTVTLLHVAALRGNAGVFQYLLNNGFKQLLNELIVKNILHFCMIDTQECEQEVEVDERKQMIEFILKVQPNLIKETYVYATPLLVPNININLLMHLINLGADVYSFDARSQNILHLSACYLSPLEYHQLVNSKLLNAKSDNKSTPLHTAVKCLEIMDTTIELFSSSGVDFNAVDDEGYTVLMHALVNGKSARLLDSLITCGSEVDIEKYDCVYAALHLAAKHGNLSGIRYLIFRGVDVNLGSSQTPLYFAMTCKQKSLIHGIVQSLVEHGADVNAIYTNEYTPLTFALRRNKSTTIGEIEDRTIEFLKERGAEEFPALKDVWSRLRKLQMGIIDRNMEKIVDNTTCSMILLDKLLDGEILTELEVEELKMETDDKMQTSMLYQMLRRKPDLHEFMTALAQTNQTEPFSIIMTETLNSDQVKSLLRNAVIHMEYDAVEYLVKGQRLSSLLFDPFFATIIHDCMGTFEYVRPMVDDKLRIIDLVLGINQGLVNSLHKDNHTPLQKTILSHSEEKKQLELIQLLIDHKADVNVRDSKYDTPLHLAVAQKITPPNVMEIIKLLIENGADPDAVDTHGCTFLHIAPQFLSPELYAQLIEFFDSTSRGNCFKMADNHKRTYLHCVVNKLEPLKSTLEIFKKYTLDFNALDKDGNSVLFHAIAGGRSASFLNILINFGADWTIPNNNHNQPLHMAAYDSNLDALKMFISFGCHVNAFNLQEHTPLHHAVLSQNINVQVINELIKHGADVNAKNNNEKCKDPDNRTPLHEVLFNHGDKQLELIQLLSRHNADINATYNDNTLLHLAVTRKPLPPYVMEIIKLLIENGADPNVVDKQGRTFLHYAPEFLTPELYGELIEYFDSSNRANSLKMADNDNRTHLHCVVNKLEPLKSTLQIFKKHGLDFNALDKDWNSVLFHAITGGRSASFLNTIISFGADWTILNKNQDNPLHFAAYFSNLDALKMFISFGCHVNAFNLQERTPLLAAVVTENIDLELINELMKYGAQVNAKATDNRTPLHKLVLNHSDNQLELIRLLINHKADVNARDSNDNTPLHFAVMQEPLPTKLMEIIKLLIENGADPDTVNKYGHTFLHIAPQFLTPKLYAQLIDYFDSTNRAHSLKMTENHNFTHLHCAVYNLEPLKSTLEIFKKHGLDFNALDNDGDSVVNCAIEGRRTAEFLQTLFTFGADWTILNKKLETPLHAAAYFGNLSALKLFLSLGCDVNSKNILGHTPLHNIFLGKKYGEEIMTHHEVVVDKLLENGADVNARDNQGKLPIDLAKQRAEIGKVEEITLKLLEAFST